MSSMWQRCVLRRSDTEALQKPKTFDVEHETMTVNPLIGTWRLIAWENRSADGQISGTSPLRRG